MISYFHLVKAPFLCSCRHQFPERIWSHFLASHSAPNSPIRASGLFPGAILVMEMQRSLPSPSLSAAFSSYEHILPLETPLLSVSMTPTLLLFLHHILLCWAWMGFFFCYAFLLDYPVLPNNFEYRLYTNISGFDFCPEFQACGSSSQLSIWHLHLEI